MPEQPANIAATRRREATNPDFIYLMLLGFYSDFLFIPKTATKLFNC
jgi:hypothetical protein